MQDFRNLKVWERSHQLTLMVYRCTSSFPKYETFGLTSQMRRASSSIAANITEGCGRGSDAQFSNFLSIAFGSACELEYFFLLAHDLAYLSDADYSAGCQEIVAIKKMLSSLMAKLKPEYRDRMIAES